MKQQLASIAMALGTFLVLSAGVYAWKRFSTWAKLARHYPLANEWPDLKWTGTMAQVDGLFYRVTLGSNVRGVTFHGFIQRLLGTALFIPWSEIEAQAAKSFYLGNVMRLHFARDPARSIGVPSAVWRSIVTRASIGASNTSG